MKFRVPLFFHHFLLIPIHRYYLVVYYFNLHTLFSLKPPFVSHNCFLFLFIYLTYTKLWTLFTCVCPLCAFLFLHLFLCLPLSVPLTGWASWELRLTFQLHIDLRPCCCRLLHLGHNSTCHSPTFHLLFSASHPRITTLVLFPLPTPSFVSHIPRLYRRVHSLTHSTFSGKRCKEGDSDTIIVTLNFGRPVL